MAQLSDSKARNIKPTDKPLAHGGITGLSLHPSGKKGHGKWVMRYVSPITNKRRNAGLGTYPEIGIADVMKLGMDFREQLANGLDPLEEKKKQIAVVKEPSFEEAARILHAELSPGWRNVKHARQWLQTLVTYVFPIIGTMKLDEIEPAHIANVLKPVWLDKPETAS